MTYQHHRHDADETEETDMNVESLILCSISLAATFVGAGGDPSIAAVCGAMLASMIALLKAAQEKRAWQDRAISMLGTSVIGSTAPSAILHWFFPDSVQKIIWQTWSILGFLGGMAGWSVAYAFIKIIGLRSERFANRTISQFERRYLPEDQDSKDGRGQ